MPHMAYAIHMTHMTYAIHLTHMTYAIHLTHMTRRARREIITVDASAIVTSFADLPLSIYTYVHT
jgi:hypothetical protein